MPGMINLVLAVAGIGSSTGETDVTLLNGHDVPVKSLRNNCLCPENSAALSCVQTSFCLQWLAVTKETHNWSKYRESKTNWVHSHNGTSVIPLSWLRELKEEGEGYTRRRKGLGLHVKHWSWQSCCILELTVAVVPCIRSSWDWASLHLAMKRGGAHRGLVLCVHNSPPSQVIPSWGIQLWCLVKRLSLLGLFTIESPWWRQGRVVVYNSVTIAHGLWKWLMYIGMKRLTQESSICADMGKLPSLRSKDFAFQWCFGGMSTLCTWPSLMLCEHLTGSSEWILVKACLGWLLRPFEKELTLFL